MPERPYTGLTARIKINDTLIGYLNSIELNLEKDVIEVLQFGAQYKEKVPAIKNWTASAEGTVAFAAGESQHKLYQAYESGELVELTILLDSVTSFTGKALVTNLSISGAPDDAMNISAEFEGSGGTTLTLPETYFLDISSGVGGTTEPGGNIRVVAGEKFNIKVIPAIGKMADKYYVDDDEGTAVPAGTEDAAHPGVKVSTIAIPEVTADHKIRVTFKEAQE